MSTTQLDTLRTGRRSAAARLDRLPIGSFHKRIMWLLAYIFFFELGDLNTFAFAAPAIHMAWHLSISTIGFITSAAFIGMFIRRYHGRLVLRSDGPEEGPDYHHDLVFRFLAAQCLRVER